MTTTYEWIAGVLTEHLGVPEDIIEPRATFTDLELDSLSVFELGVIIEDQLGIRLEAEDFKPPLGEFCRDLEQRSDGAKPAGIDTAQQDASTTPTSP